MSDNKDEIRKHVQKYYTECARSSAPCCAPVSTDEPGQSHCCTPQSLFYPDELLATLPNEANAFSLGCGDPISQAGLQPGEVVLDLGSGGGLDCFLAAEKVGGQGRVIGVDMTAEMIALARTHAARLGLSNVEFRQGYLEDLPIDDESIDVVISNCVINLSPDKPRVFREIWRALKPGGRLSIADMVTNGALPEELRNDMHAWGSCLAGALEVSEYISGLVEAGFTQVTVEPKDDTAGSSIHMASPRGVFSANITARKPAH